MIEGIDTSSWQGEYVDWHKVKNNNIDFVFIKSTQDQSYFNEYFSDDWDDAKAVSLVRGTYHFADPHASGPAESFTFFKSKVRHLHPGDLIALDIEIDHPELTKWTAEWMDLVEREYFAQPILYTNLDYVNRYFRNTGLQRYSLWLASYSKHPDSIDQSGLGPIKFWQYTDTGKVNGVDGFVDRNQFLGTYGELRDMGAK